MTWINIPENWTGKEALSVVEFLDEFSAAIWKVHEPKMLEAFDERYKKNASENDEDENDHNPVDCPYDRFPDPIELDDGDDIPF